MITAQVEPWQSFLPELRGMIDGHYEQLALNKETVPLSPRWDVYDARDRDGSLLLVTLRHDGVAAGYFIGLCMPGLHYSTCLTLQCDIFFVHPASRTGFSGVRLFRAVEAEARRRGVQRWVVSTKLHDDAGALLRRLKFTSIETVYSKMLEN